MQETLPKHLSEINQLVHDLRQEVDFLKSQNENLKKMLAEETKIRYELYKKVSSTAD